MTDETRAELIKPFGRVAVSALSLAAALATHVGASNLLVRSGRVESACTVGIRLLEKSGPKLGPRTRGTQSSASSTNAPLLIRHSHQFQARSH